MPTWPSTLPGWIIAGYQEGEPETTIRTSNDTGPPNSRRRFTAAPAPVAAQTLWTDAQVATFRTWFKVDLAGGALSFDKADQTPPGSPAGTVRKWKYKAAPQRVPGSQSGLLWRYSHELEILP